MIIGSQGLAIWFISVIRHLNIKLCTFFPFFFELQPSLEIHFEFLEDEVVGESVPSGVPLDEIVLVGGILFNRSVQVDTIPTSYAGYQ